MNKKSHLTKIISITIALIVLLAGLSIGVTVNAATMKYNIDYTKTASLTLYKYEMSDVSKATHGGTGEKNDEQYIPSDAKRLAGVTFTVRKVAELSTYFKPDGVSLPTASAAKSMSPIGNPVSKKFVVYFNEESAKNGTNAIMTAESNADGIVSFKGLAYGKFAKTAAQKAADGVDNGSTDYWINEIKTGNGYNLLKDPVKITVNKTSGDDTKTFPVINTDTPKLTPTGGAAYGMMIAGAGVGVLGFAIFWLVRKHKKSKNDSN